MIKTMRLSGQVQESEQMVLGECLTSEAGALLVLRMVRTEQFSFPQHKAIFEAIREVFEAGVTPSLVSVITELEATQKINLAGGREYVAQCGNAALGTHAQAGSAINAMLRQWRMWESAERCRAIIELAEKGDYKGMLGGLQSLDSGLFDGGSSVTHSSQIEEILSRPLQPGIPTGIEYIDRVIGDYKGLSPGEYHIIAGNTGKGKTYLMLQAVLRCALSGGRVVLGTIELKDEMIYRRLCKLLCGYLSEAHAEAEGMGKEFREAMHRVKDSDITVYDPNTAIRPDSKATTYAGFVRSVHERAPIDLWAVDYFQIMQPDRYTDNKTRALSEVAETLRALGRQTDAAGIVLAQARFDRAPGAKASDRDGDWNIKDCKALKDACATMWVLNQRDDAPDASMHELINCKNRHGKEQFTQSITRDPKTLLCMDQKTAKAITAAKSRGEAISVL